MSVCIYTCLILFASVLYVYESICNTVCVSLFVHVFVILCWSVCWFVCLLACVPETHWKIRTNGYLCVCAADKSNRTAEPVKLQASLHLWLRAWIKGCVVSTVAINYQSSFQILSLNQKFAFSTHYSVSPENWRKRKSLVRKTIYNEINHDSKNWWICIRVWNIENLASKNEGRSSTRRHHAGVTPVTVPLPGSLDVFVRRHPGL